MMRRGGWRRPGRPAGRRQDLPRLSSGMRRMLGPREGPFSYNDFERSVQDHFRDRPAVLPGVVTVQTSTDLGSGIVYNSDGYIVTNAHVVGTVTKVEVDFSDGTKVYGNVVGTDQNSDLAAIKVTVPANELHPLSLGDSSALKIGETVSAIGDPLPERMRP